MGKLKKLNSYKKYGSFSKDATEFIIRDPQTPRPWINYLSNGRFCSLVSQVGGGYHFYLDPSYNRLTRWEPANYLSDTPGRYIYLRDNKTRKYWSATYFPTKNSTKFRCLHGLGYTTISSQKNNIKCQVTFFVPQDANLEVWLIEVTNLSNKKADLTVFNFVEWLIGLWRPELEVRNLAVLMNAVKYDASLGAIIAEKFPWGNRKWPYFCYLATNLKMMSYETNYEEFIGRYRNYSNPIQVEKGKCSNTNIRGLNSVGVLASKLKLKPKEKKKFVVILGISQSKAKAKALLKSYLKTSFVERKLAETKKWWQKAICENIKVTTPDEDINTAVNVWMKYQIYMNNHWGRSATYYHEGYGGFGYRNTAQDAWAMANLDSKYTKEKIIELSYHQRKTGEPLAGWSYETGPETQKPPSDFPIWLPFTLISYIKETGDFKFLKKKVKFFDGPKATIYEHAKRATRFLMDVAKSRRGLPLMGTQDWNDAFDRVGIGGSGESIWLGMGLCVALKNMLELASFLKDKKTEKECLSRYKKMKDIINRYAWDGEWYVYAFNDYGLPVGSKKNKEGKIQLNAQTWAILAGLPNEKQLRSMLRVIDKDLDTKYGPVLFVPPYTKYDGTIGRITAFAPGTKENAAIFCHAGAFKVAADLMLGRANQAYDTITKLLPGNSKRDVEVYKTEPYCFSEYIIGPGNTRFGEGVFSWLTGSVDWMFKVICEWMLGVRPEFDGLRIDPCLPKSWKKCKIIRPFRGASYKIEILNPKGKTKGLKKLIVDGKEVASNIIKPHRDSKTHKVKAILG